MKFGDAEYRRLLRRYNQLEWLTYPSAEERIEMININARLTEVELKGRGLRALVDDYDLMTREAGNLGGVELI